MCAPRFSGPDFLHQEDRGRVPGNETNNWQRRKQKAPRSDSAGPEKFAATRALVLGNQRMRSLWAPDPEAKAGPKVQTTNALRCVLRSNGVGEPKLKVDRAKIVANKSTDCAVSVLIADAQRGCGNGTAGIARRLKFEVTNRAD